MKIDPRYLSGDDCYFNSDMTACGNAGDSSSRLSISAWNNLKIIGTHGGCESDLEELLSRADVIDNIVVHYLRAVIEYKRYPELAFRTCRGIMNLEKKYGQERLVSGCAAAMDAHRYCISDIVDILESGADADYLPGAEVDDEQPQRPTHRNIRGKEYFAASIIPSTQNDNVKNGNKR